MNLIYNIEVIKIHKISNRYNGNYISYTVYILNNIS